MPDNVLRAKRIYQDMPQAKRINVLGTPGGSVPSSPCSR